MTLADGAAAAAILGLVVYAVLGGADFGGGVWTALARGPRRDAQREAIKIAMGPVWEANHVWLVFVVVVLFSCFPAAWALFTTAASIPLRIALLGIALRGVAFVFRSHTRARSVARERWATAFGLASIVTPVVLGMTVGASASGVVPGSPERAADLPFTAFLGPLSLSIGLAALSLSAYAAAVFLAAETSGELREDFRKRALYAGTVVVAGAVLTLPLLARDAPHLLVGLMRPRAAVVVTVGTIAALASGGCLWKRQVAAARIATIVQIACIVAGFGLSQYPYVVYPHFTVASTAAPRGTLLFALGSLPVGLAIVVPSLVWLLRVFKSERSGDRETS